MRPKTLIPKLAKAFQDRRSVLLEGPPGIGKSDILDQACALAQADHLVLHLVTHEPTDGRGMPMGWTDDNGRQAEFIPFGDLKKLMSATRLTVADLEDVGQARPAVRSAWMQPLLRRSIGDHKISDNVVFCASTNGVEHAAACTPLETTFLSRFHTVLTVDVNTNDWLDWYASTGMDARVAAYIRTSPADLHKFDKSCAKTNKAFACPRTWANTGRWLTDGEDDAEILVGSLGPEIGVKFTGFLALIHDLPPLTAIWSSPKTTPVPEQPGTRCFVACALAQNVTPKNIGAALEYCVRMGKEYEFYLMNDSALRNPAVIATPEFTKWSSDPVNQKLILGK